MFWLSRLDPIDQAGEAKVRVGPARRVTLPSRRAGDPASSRANFLFHVNGSPDFVRKCMKSWLAQGNPGTLHFFFYKNIFYKNIEAEICKILRMNQTLRFWKGYHFVCLKNRLVKVKHMFLTSLIKLFLSLKCKTSQQNEKHSTN